MSDNSTISLTRVNQGNAIQTENTVKCCDAIAKFAGLSVAVITFTATIFLDHNFPDGNNQNDNGVVLGALFAAGISGCCMWSVCKIIGDRCLQSRSITSEDPENTRMAVTEREPPPQSPLPDHLSTITEPVALRTESEQHLCSLEQAPGITDEKTPLVSRG